LPLCEGGDYEAQTLKFKQMYNRINTVYFSTTPLILGIRCCAYFFFNQILNMKTEIKIYNKMKRKDFGESMRDETKLKVLNWVLKQVYEKRCKCYRLTGSDKEYQTNLCPIHKSE